MRNVCDFVSAVCVDPTVTHSLDVAGHIKYVCLRHAAIIGRHPSCAQPPTVVYDIDVAVPA